MKEKLPTWFVACSMLAWNPAERTSAARALQHPCFLPDNSSPSQPPPLLLTQPSAVHPSASYAFSFRHQRSWVVIEATSKSTSTESSSSQGGTGASMLAFQQQRARSRIRTHDGQGRGHCGGGSNSILEFIDVIWPISQGEKRGQCNMITSKICTASQMIRPWSTIYSADSGSSC